MDPYRIDIPQAELADLSHTVTRWSEYPRGGHFASLQAPDLLVDDIRAFFATIT